MSVSLEWSPRGRSRRRRGIFLMMKVLVVSSWFKVSSVSSDVSFNIAFRYKLVTSEVVPVVPVVPVALDVRLVGVQSVCLF